MILVVFFSCHQCGSCNTFMPMWAMHLEDTLFSALTQASATIHISLKAKTEVKLMRPC